MNAQWTSLIDVAGWTLLHFVWQGTLAALAPRPGPLARAAQVGPRPVCPRVPRARRDGGIAGRDGVVPRESSADRQVMAFDGSGIEAAGPRRSPARRVSIASVSGAIHRACSARVCCRHAPLFAALAQAPPSTWFPWLVGFWLVGVGVCSVRLAGGWWHTRRLVREDAFEAEEAWVQAVGRLSTRLRLARTVRLLESARVQVPDRDRVAEAGAAASGCGDDRAVAAAGRSRPGARARAHPAARLPRQPRAVGGRDDAVLSPGRVVGVAHDPRRARALLRRSRRRRVRRCRCCMRAH